MRERNLAAWSTDKEILMQSSSGGLFSEFANKMMAEGGYVVGVKIDVDSLKTEYSISNDPCVVKKMRGSKYAPSSPKNILPLLRSWDANIPVLVTGLPCHIEAIKKQCDTSNMILVDIRCHGLPRAGVFEDHIRNIAGNRKIQAIRFRDKIGGWENGPISQTLIIEFENGDVYDKYDEYIVGYLENTDMLRTQCQTCRKHHVGDITIGDFWGVPRKKYNLFGTSVVDINTKKGSDFYWSIPTIETHKVHFYDRLYPDYIGWFVVLKIWKVLQTAKRKGWIKR